jgi:hypothetical protein
MVQLSDAALAERSAVGWDYGAGHLAPSWRAFDKTPRPFFAEHADV